MVVATSPDCSLVLNDCSLEQQTAGKDAKNTNKIKKALLDFINRTERLPSELIIDGEAHDKLSSIELNTLGIKPGCSRTVEYLSVDRKHCYRLRFKRPIEGKISLSDVESSWR